MLRRIDQWGDNTEGMFFDENDSDSFMVVSVGSLVRALLVAFSVPVGTHRGLSYFL